MFKLRKMCDNCPFRKEGAIELAPGRVEGIVENLSSSDHNLFPCHKTTHIDGTYDGENGNEEGRYYWGTKDQHCMGALAYLNKYGPQLPVAARVGIALGELKWADIKRAEKLLIKRVGPRRRR